MKITIEIDEREINNIGGLRGEEFVIEELRRDPGFFLTNASNITVYYPKERGRNAAIEECAVLAEELEPRSGIAYDIRKLKAVA